MKSFISGCMALLLLIAASACRQSIKDMVQEGVSIELAQYRYKHISDVQYALSFNVPEIQDQAVTGAVTIGFRLRTPDRGVIVDFTGGEERIREVLINGNRDDYTVLNGHIMIPSRYLVPGYNEVFIAFESMDQALNRSVDFLYSLFVPDRASTAFPCFDQPDLKAQFSLELTLPASWMAMSNGPLTAETTYEDRKVQRFEMNQPISTYLFAFTAGRFDSISAERDGRRMLMFHREPDDKKILRNAGIIFDQHARALKWLEEYTGIPYPFDKLDMVLLPGFQYSGMEHPGAIWYRDSRLLLDEQAPMNMQLSRASLIAHETAHMWFGNLVTMKWFDDVWLKEVFAGFMADKMVHPEFPDINHELQFLLTHFPRAMAVDRSKGTHPIKQTLGNMKEAGTLYGAIIYNKAPIVFRELERLMGEDAFRLALKEYLSVFSFGNADWTDLAAIFDRYSENDLLQWSDTWIYGTGMPAIYTRGMDEDYLRAADFLMAYEDLVNNPQTAGNFLPELLRAISREQDPQIARYLLNNLNGVFWRFLNSRERLEIAGMAEGVLWDRLLSAPESEKSMYAETFAQIALTPESINKVALMAEGKSLAKGFDPGEEHRFVFVSSLLLREHPGAEDLYLKLLDETLSPDRKRRMVFVHSALSSDKATRDAFFNSLKEPSNRRPEPWVIEALGYLHHPLRAGASAVYLSETLNMLPEIQQTGDIFFPLNWVEASLLGYSDVETARMVEDYLSQTPELMPSLRLKLLQASDLLFRISAVR